MELQKKGQRFIFIDVLKMFAIFLVVWGHTPEIPHNTTVPNYGAIFANSFHMPLFYFLSGLFFMSSLKLKFGTFLKKKSCQLLLPWFVWCIILFVYREIAPWITTAVWNGMVPGKVDFHNDIWNIVNHIFCINYKGLSSFWFLKELFISYCVTYICYKLFHKWIFVVLVSCVFFYIVIPENFAFQQRILFPYFLLGILCRNHFESIRKYMKEILLLSIFLYLALLPFWKLNYDVFPRLFLWTLHRFVFLNIGDTVKIYLLMSSRIALFFSLFYYLFNNENRVSLFLSDIGRYTLVIYVLQVVIIEYTLNRFHFYETANSAVFNFIVSPSIAAVIVLASFGIGKLTHKCPKLELVLFGRYY